MSEIHIRRGVAGDAGALAELAARTFADAFAADNRPEDLRAHAAEVHGIRQQTAELTDAAIATLLADQGGTLLAYAQVRRHPPPPCVNVDRPIELQRFYVDRSAHGTGLAQRLMSAARDAARDFGGRHLWLGVWERNPRAIAFYRKEGFIDVGSKYYDVGADRQIDRVLVAGI